MIFNTPLSAQYFYAERRGEFSLNFTDFQVSVPQCGDLWWTPNVGMVEEINGSHHAQETKKTVEVPDQQTQHPDKVPDQQIQQTVEVHGNFTINNFNPLLSNTPMQPIRQDLIHCCCQDPMYQFLYQNGLIELYPLMIEHVVDLAALLLFEDKHFVEMGVCDYIRDRVYMALYD